jgi:uncharacterized delta-60 repeat protein
LFGIRAEDIAMGRTPTWFLFASILLVSGAACASDGDVDGSFGNAGNILLAPADASLSPYAVAVQDDGKILIGGSRWAFGQDPSLNQAAIWRFLQDGAPDPGFGDGGLSAIALPPAVPFVFSVLPLGNGDILAAGNLGGFAVLRLHGDGSVDSQFGSNGLVVVDFTDLQLTGGSARVSVDSKGRILLAGGGKVIDPSNANWSAGAVARLLPDGTPDAEFGNAGRFVYRVGTAADGRSAFFFSANTDDQNRVWLSGHVNLTAYSATQSFLAARLDEHGALDPAFGTGGVAASNLAADSDDWSQDAVLDHGRWTIGGTCDPYTATSYLCAWRINEDGTPDMTFGSSGWATSPLTGSLMRPGALACQSDGRCLVLGTAPSPTTSLREFVVARFDVSGNPDVAFGSAGLARISIPVSGSGSHVAARGIAMQSGRPILVGTTDGVPYVNALFATRLANDLIFSAHFD